MEFRRNVKRILPTPGGVIRYTVFVTRAWSRMMVEAPSSTGAVSPPELGRAGETDPAVRDREVNSPGRFFRRYLLIAVSCQPSSPSRRSPEMSREHGCSSRSKTDGTANFHLDKGGDSLLRVFRLWRWNGNRDRQSLVVDLLLLSRGRSARGLIAVFS